MEQFATLPARELLLPEESLESVVRRQTLAMGYERIGRIRALVQEYGPIPPSLNHLKGGAVMARLSKLFGIPTADLQQSTVHQFAEELMVVRPHAPVPADCDSQAILKYFRRRTAQVCPECLQCDIPYERLLWNFRPLPVCLLHGRFLIDGCPSCQRSLSPLRLDIRRCHRGHDLSKVLPAQLSDRLKSVFQSVRDWLLGHKAPAAGLSSSALFWWLERLKSAVTRTPSWIADLRRREDVSPEITDESMAWVAAAEILIDWPQRFEEFLDVFQTVTKHRTTSTGVSRSFGLLLREAGWLEGLGYAAPAEGLRQYLWKRYTRGHLNAKVCLFRGDAQDRMEERPWLTRTQAAKRLGLRHTAIKDLIQRGLLRGEVRPAGNCGRSVGVISRDSVEALRRQLANSVTINVASVQLGIGRSATLELIHRNVLAEAVRTAQGWLIPAESVECWKQFVATLSIRSGEAGPWLSIRDAMRRSGRSGLTLAVLLDRVRTRQVRACRSGKGQSLQGIFVHEADLQLSRESIRMQQHAAHGYPLHRLAQELVPGRPLKDVVLRKWIAAGLLSANPRGRIQVVTSAVVERFRNSYCLADEACTLLGISRTTLSRWEMAGRIVAVYSRRSHEGAGASVFRREDVARLRLEDLTSNIEDISKAA